MNHLDWMEHCLQSGRAQLKAYHDASPELRRRLMDAEEARRLAWLITAQEKVLAMLEREQEPPGALALVATYMHTYADLHVRYWTRDGDKVRAGVSAARRKLVADLRRMRAGERVAV